MKIQYFLRIILLMSPLAGFAQSTDWHIVYKDNYNYSQQSPASTTFNTWFWREDSAATHRFEITNMDGCSDKMPCVELSAQAYPANTEYTNAEMYNNSCILNPKTNNPIQSLVNLKENVWGKPLYNKIESICGIPYPYQSQNSYLTPYGLTSSWTKVQPAILETNPLALTSEDKEKPWKAIRDIVFNTPYLAQKDEAIRLTTEIKAVTKNQGGSRGWGFWNTSLDPDLLGLAWFMEYSIPQTLTKEGKTNRFVIMQTIGQTANNADEIKMCSTSLDPQKFDIYQWHNYQIEWTNNQVRYFVDQQLVADHTNISLNKTMAFHNWVDNRNYIDSKLKVANFPLTEKKSNYIRQFIVEGSKNHALTTATSLPTSKCSVINKKLLDDILKELANGYL